MTSYQTSPTKTVRGTIRVASDKSISHRSLIFAALAEGESRIKNLLLGEDVLRTLTILNQLGVKTSHTAESLREGDELIVHGVGFAGLKVGKSKVESRKDLFGASDLHTRYEIRDANDVFYCGNSGTTMRLMLGLLSGQPFESVLTGDDSLNKRPMERVMAPLRQMGARFETREHDGKRLIVVNPQMESGIQILHGISYASPVASAQVKSAILIAGLFAEGETCVTEPSLSRNHTEIILAAMGAPLSVKGLAVTVNKPSQSLHPIYIDIPGDISSAAFFMVAALIVPDSDITIENVSLNPTRTGILDVLQKMGGNITILNLRKSCGEEVGDLRVKSSKLVNTTIAGDLIPRLIDEIPILALAGACAWGQMVVSDAKELRVKETDRIKAICTELSKLGVSIIESEDGFVVDGKGVLSEIRDTKYEIRFQSRGDHRMAMMEAIAGLILPNFATIDDVDCINTSFPTFFELLHTVVSQY